MVQVRLEVRTGAARFRVSVSACSVQRAVSLADARYRDGEVRVISSVQPILSGARPIRTPMKAAA